MRATLFLLLAAFAPRASAAPAALELDSEQGTRPVAEAQVLSDPSGTLSIEGLRAQERAGDRKSVV